MKQLIRQRYAVRLSPLERELLEQIAAAEAVKPSEAARLAIREAARARGLWPVSQGVSTAEARRWHR